jgi:ligand-binding sensor domain-containing protein
MRNFLITIIILPILLSAQTEGKKTFSFSSSPIPDQNITAIATDNTGLNWIGTLEGIICYNGKRWHTITTNNSKLPSNKILSIKIEGNTKYIGTTEGLLVIVNNTWDVYTSKKTANFLLIKSGKS